MSMQEPTDDQLDGLFRKSAEEFDTPFDPAAWQALKNRLDTHDRLSPWEHLLRWGLPVLLLLLLTAGSWNARQQQIRAGQLAGSGVTRPKLPSGDGSPVGGGASLPNGTVAANLTKSADSEEAVAGKPADTDYPTSTGNSNEPGRSVDEAVASSPGKRDRLNTSEVVDRKSRPDGPAVSASDRSNRIEPAGSASTGAARTKRSGFTTARSKQGLAGVAVNERIERVVSGMSRQNQARRVSGKRAIASPSASFMATNYATTSAKSFTKRQSPTQEVSEPVANDPQSGMSSLPATNATESVVGFSFSELSSRQGHWPGPLAFTGRDVTMPTDPALPVTANATQPVLTQPALSQKGLSVRVVVAPDLSGVGLRDFQRPGTNVGLLLEYRLASRWSVQAGVIRSTKVYKASASEYYLPDALKAKWKVFPQSVDGRCNILDIPINLRYDIALRPRQNGMLPSRWFVSGGVTTYIMQKEDYYYTYADVDKPHVYPNAYPSMTEWHGKTGAYGLSQLNLSAGYERALSRRLSWQVEPFMKVPLKGVGYFKIDLLSTGAFFSIRYKL
jgi:hypothetical protein